MLNSFLDKTFIKYDCVMMGMSGCVRHSIRALAVDDDRLLSTRMFIIADDD